MKQVQYLINEKGCRKAVLMSIKEYKRLTELAQNAIDISLIEETEKEQYRNWEEVKKELKNQIKQV